MTTGGKERQRQQQQQQQKCDSRGGMRAGAGVVTQMRTFGMDSQLDDHNSTSSTVIRRIIPGGAGSGGRRRVLGSLPFLPRGRRRLPRLVMLPLLLSLLLGSCSVARAQVEELRILTPLYARPGGEYTYGLEALILIAHVWSLIRQAVSGGMCCRSIYIRACIMPVRSSREPKIETQNIDDVLGSAVCVRVSEVLRVNEGKELHTTAVPHARSMVPTVYCLLHALPTFFTTSIRSFYALHSVYT